MAIEVHSTANHDSYQVGKLFHSQVSCYFVVGTSCVGDYLRIRVENDKEHLLKEGVGERGEK
jgi:hypothetical protein